MEFLWKITVISYLTLVETYSSVVGRYYAESAPFDASVKYRSGSDPCNPLYWYPRQIPEYCFNKPEQPVRVSSVPLPLGPPPPPSGTVPLPQGPVQIPVPMIPPPPLNFNINPSQMSYGPYSFLHPSASYQIPFPTGPVNILPFSDVYSDLLAKRSFRKFMKKHHHHN